MQKITKKQITWRFSHQSLKCHLCDQLAEYHVVFGDGRVKVNLCLCPECSEKSWAEINETLKIKEG